MYKNDAHLKKNTKYLAIVAFSRQSRNIIKLEVDGVGLVRKIFNHTNPYPTQKSTSSLFVETNVDINPFEKSIKNEM